MVSVVQWLQPHLWVLGLFSVVSYLWIVVLVRRSEVRNDLCHRLGDITLPDCIFLFVGAPTAGQRGRIPHYRMLSRIPGVNHWRPIIFPTPAWQPKTSPDIANVSWEAKSPPVEKHCCRETGRRKKWRKTSVSFALVATVALISNFFRHCQNQPHHGSSETRVAAVLVVLLFKVLIISSSWPLPWAARWPQLCPLFPQL